MWADKFSEAAEHAEVNFRMQPEEPCAYIVLASVYGFQDRNQEAEQVVAALLKQFPAYSMRDVRISERYAEPADFQRVEAVLRRAGLPE